MVNQGNWGSRAGFLDFGFADAGGRTNPHSNINASDNVVTMDGYNKRVGIYQMNPQARLHVRAAGNDNPANNGVYIYNEDTGGDNDDAIITTRVNGSSAGDPFFSMDVAGITGWSVGLDNSDGDKLKFANSWSNVGTNTRMTLQTNGNLGVGTTNPAARIHATGTYSYVSGDDAMLKIKSVNNGGCCGTEAITLQTSIDNRTDDYTIASYGGDERHVLALQPQGGYVGVGTINPTYKLHVNGRLRTTGINETSDIRLKKNIVPIESALDKVADMNGVTYNWRTEEYPNHGLSEDLQHGLIAQELEEIIPELVLTDSDGFKSIEYTHLVPVLIEAIKELKKTNDIQSELLNVQNTRINDLTKLAETNSKTVGELISELREYSISE